MLFLLEPLECAEEEELEDKEVTVESTLLEILLLLLNDICV